METKINIQLHSIQSTLQDFTVWKDHIVLFPKYTSQLVDRVYGNYNSHWLLAPRRGAVVWVGVGGGVLAGNSCWSTRGV